MEIDVAASIGELLYENQGVIIPNFGGLMTTSKSATIDQVQGAFYPPAKELSFNSNLVTNDGVLIDYIREQYHVSYESAKAAIEDFVLFLNQTMDKRETIVLPEVGRFYKDFEDKIKFIPDSTNFNADSFGLPSVQFYPILRDREPLKKVEFQKTAPPVLQSVQNKTASYWQENGANLAQKAMPYLLGFAILLVAFGIFYVLKDTDKKINDGSSIQAQLQSDNESIRINQKPAFIEETEEDEGINAATTEELEQEVINSNIDTEGSTFGPNTKECIIIIGGFANKNNVEKLIKELYDAGYDAYTDKKGRITRVGAMFAYQEEDQIDDVLEDVKKKFNRKAWILPPSERVR